MRREQEMRKRWKVRVMVAAGGSDGYLLCVVLVDGEEEEQGEGPVCEEEPHHLTKGIQINKLTKVRRMLRSSGVNII